MNRPVPPRLTEHTYEGVTLKEGDFIEAYETGYHVVIAIYQRFYDETDYRLKKPDNTKKVGDEDNPMVIYRRVISVKGNKVKRKGEIQCSWEWVHKIDDEFIEDQKQAEIKKWDGIVALSEDFNNNPW